MGPEQRAGIWVTRSVNRLLGQRVASRGELLFARGPAKPALLGVLARARAVRTILELHAPHRPRRGVISWAAALAYLRREQPLLHK